MGQGLVLEVCKLSLDQLRQVLSDQVTGQVLAACSGDVGAPTSYQRDDLHDVLERDDVDYVHLYD